MRNAAASFDEDFGYDEPARKKAPRKPRASPGRKKKKGGRFDWNRVARYAAIGMSATVAFGIMYNALVAQKGHHPAPLFGKATPAVQTSQAPVAAQALTARAAPEQADDAADNHAQDTTAPPPVAKPRHVAQRADLGDDPIARLLQTGSAPAGADRADPKTVIAAQKALTKLGFAVKANGTMGPATRKALERFEQDHHMAAKGGLTRRIVKMLSAESGVKID